MRTLRLVTVGLAAAAIVGCQDPLNVDNSNNPDRARALARPSDVEALIGASYQVVHNGTLGAFCAINIQSMSMGLENQSNLSNNQMGPRAAIPRSPVDNSRGNAGASGNRRDWFVLNRAARQAAVGLAAVNAPSFTFFPASAPQVARAKAMAHFIIGTALGNIALIYDQGSVISPSDNGNDPTPLPFVTFDSLMTYALAELDSSMHYDSLATSSWPGVAALSWFGSPGLTMSQDSMVAFARGYKARFRAGVVRNPTDRADIGAGGKVDWTKVIADATAFATKWGNGVVLPMLPSAGWDIGYIGTIFQSDQGNWTMEWMFIVGMADTTTAAPFNAWLNTSAANKQPFLVVTNDKRFPTGATRAAQQTAGGQGSVTAPMAAGVYIRNRAAPDWAGDPYGNSWYDHDRWAAFKNASRIGNFPIMTATEIRMLAAEGNIRLGNFAAAATLIDVTRVPNGLPSIAAMGIVSAVTPIGPDAVHCTPHTPLLTAASTGTVSCATIMEAMKWEKRLEEQFTAPYSWYIDGRGWGDLPLNTATMWPTPIEEIDSRQLFANPPPYVSSYGGGAPNSALTSTYGLGLP